MMELKTKQNTFTDKKIHPFIIEIDYREKYFFFLSLSRSLEDVYGDRICFIFSL